jgi:predicted nuclease of predicted toxin-antitoxin system
VPKFLVDESTGVRIAELLKDLGYDTYSVAQKIRGATDQRVLSKAVREKRILITNDKELASLAILQRPLGIILLRLSDERTNIKLQVLRKVLIEYGNKIEGNLIVASEKKVRIRPI